MSKSFFRERFLGQLAPDLRLNWAQVPELDDTLSAVLEQSQAAWPDVKLPAEEFAEHLARQVLPSATPGLVSPHACDLYLALAAARGDVAGMLHFESHVLRPLTKLLYSRGLAEDAVQESLQAIRVRMFTSNGTTAPRLLSYSGKAPLKTWARAVMVNYLSNECERASQRTARMPDDDLLLSKILPSGLGGPDQMGDAERVLVQLSSQLVVQEALRAALRKLGTQDGLLLKLCYVDGLRLHQMAKLHRVDKSTISRRLAAARSALLEALRDELASRLHLSPTEADSLIRLVISQVDVSLSRLLASPPQSTS